MHEVRIKKRKEKEQNCDSFWRFSVMVYSMIPEQFSNCKRDNSTRYGNLTGDIWRRMMNAHVNGCAAKKKKKKQMEKAKPEKRIEIEIKSKRMKQSEQNDTHTHTHTSLSLYIYKVQWVSLVEETDNILWRTIPLHNAPVWQRMFHVRYILKYVSILACVCLCISVDLWIYEWVFLFLFKSLPYLWVFTFALLAETCAFKWNGFNST